MPEPVRSKHIIADLLREPSQAEQQAIYDLIIEGERIVYEGNYSGVVSEDYDKRAFEAIVNQIEALSGERLEHSYFVIVHGGDAEEDARFFASPKSEPVKDLTACEILALLVAATDGDLMDHQAKIMRFLEQSLGEAFDMTLLFFPYAQWTNEELTVEIEHRRTLLAKGGNSLLDDYEHGIAQAIISSPEPKYWELQWATPKLFPGDRARQAAEINKHYPR